MTGRNTPTTDVQVEHDEDYYTGKTVRYECGWDGGCGYIYLSELISRAQKEFPNLSPDKVAITIYQETAIVMFDPAAQKSEE